MPLAAPLRNCWTVWDDTNKVQVRLEYEGDGLESLTDDQVLAGGNAAVLGQEIIQFGIADPIGPAKDKIWELSHLLRGRKGTEWAIGLHVAGERFTLLDAATVARLSDSLAELNFTRLYRAVTSGKTIADSTSLPFVNTGNAFRPYAPCFVRGSRDISGNLEITWLRRSRFTNSFNPWNSPPLGEDSEAYSLDIFTSAGATVRTIPTTTPLAVYLASEQVVDFGTPQAAIAIGLYMISAKVGRGFPNLALL